MNQELLNQELSLKAVRAGHRARDAWALTLVVDISVGSKLASCIQLREEVVERLRPDRNNSGDNHAPENNHATRDQGKHHATEGSYVTMMKNKIVLSKYSDLIT